MSFPIEHGDFAIVMLAYQSGNPIEIPFARIEIPASYLKTWEIPLKSHWNPIEIPFFWRDFPIPPGQPKAAPREDNDLDALPESLAELSKLRMLWLEAAVTRGDTWPGCRRMMTFRVVKHGLHLGKL